MCVVVLVSGPSAVGKESIISRALEKDPAWQRGRTLTTGEQRPDDVMYDFAESEAAFHAAFERGELLERSQHFGAWYGKKAPSSDGLWLLELEVDGAEEARKKLPGAFKVFIDASDKELRRRLTSRESKRPQKKRMSKKEFEERIERAAYERRFASEHRTDLVIINHDLETAADELVRFLWAAFLTARVRR